MTAIQRVAENHFQCILCRNLWLWNEEAVLPCLHTFCVSCLTDHCKRENLKDQKLPCPECTLKHDIPNNGLKGFKKSLVKKRVIPFEPNENCLQHNEEIKLYCFCCSQKLCLKCLNNHKFHWFDYFKNYIGLEAREVETDIYTDILEIMTEYSIPQLLSKLRRNAFKGIENFDSNLINDLKNSEHKEEILKGLKDHVKKLHNLSLMFSNETNQVNQFIDAIKS